MREILLEVLLLHVFQCLALQRQSFFNEDEVELIRRSRQSDLETCNEDRLVEFLAEIQVINPESIIKLATFSEIQSSCNKVSTNLGKIKQYLIKCRPPAQSDLYMQLIKGVESLHEKICTESDFKKKFEKIYFCVHELRNDFDDCGGPADWNENSDSSEVCKAYKDITDCYYIKTAKVCGKEAAKVTKELLEAIVNSIITVNCVNVKSDPVVNDAMPEAYLGKNKGNCVKVPIASVIAEIIIIYNL